MDKTREELIYDFIVSFTQQNLYPPSIREICSATGLKSTSSVAHYLTKLQIKGLIICGSKPRTIKIVGYKLEKV